MTMDASEHFKLKNFQVVFTDELYCKFFNDELWKARFLIFNNTNVFIIYLTLVRIVAKFIIYLYLSVFAFVKMVILQQTLPRQKCAESNT